MPNSFAKKNTDIINDIHNKILQLDAMLMLCKRSLHALSYLVSRSVHERQHKFTKRIHTQ